MSEQYRNETIFAGRDESASETLHKIGLKADETGKKLSGMGSIVGGVSLGNMLTNVLRDVTNFAKQSVNAYATVGAEVLKLQRSTGGSAQEASKLRFAFHETGLDVTAAGISIKTFSKHVEVNDKAIKAMSVTTRDSNGHFLSTNTILMEVADRFKSMPNGIEKTAAAVNLFGKSGQQMLPFLNQGKQGLMDLEAEAQKYGLVLTQNNLDAIQKNIMAHRELSAAMQGAQLQIGQVLLPVMTQMTKGFTDFLVQIRPVVENLVTGLKPAVADIAGVLKDALGALGTFVKFLSDHPDAAKAFGDGIVVMVAGLVAFKTAAKLAKSEIILFNLALAETPVGAIAAIVALLAGFAINSKGDTKSVAVHKDAISAESERLWKLKDDQYFSMTGRHLKKPVSMTAQRYGAGGSGEYGADAHQIDYSKKDPSKTDPFYIDQNKNKTPAFNLGKAVGTDFIHGLVGSTSQVVSTINSMVTMAYAAAKAGKTNPDNLITALKAQQKQMVMLAEDRDLTIKRLVAAQGNLKSLQDQSKQLADQISQGIVSSYSITSGNSPQTLSGMLAGMTRNADRARKLADALKLLKDQGLDAALLKDIATAGTERGLDVAQQIMIGGASGVQQLNTLQGAISSYAKDAGQTVGDATFAGGISIAQKLVDSLTSEKAKILESIQDLATSIQKIFDNAIKALATGQQKAADAGAKKLTDLVNVYPGTDIKGHEDLIKLLDPKSSSDGTVTEAENKILKLLDPTLKTSPVGTRVLTGGSNNGYGAGSGMNGLPAGVSITIRDSIGATNIAQKVVDAIYTLNRTNGRNIPID
jgi:hypothetical protein